MSLNRFLYGPKVPILNYLLWIWNNLHQKFIYLFIYRFVPSITCNRLFSNIIILSLHECDVIRKWVAKGHLKLYMVILHVSNYTTTLLVYCYFMKKIAVMYNSQKSFSKREYGKRQSYILDSRRIICHGCFYSDSLH